MSLDSINTEQRLYVMQEGSGYSCLGFDVAYERACKAAQWLAGKGELVTSAPSLLHIGTEEGYREYRETYDALRRYYLRTGEKCPTELTPELIGLEGRRIEVVDCYGQTRRFQVGRSTGWIPIHLEIARKTSHGGIPVSGAPFQSVRIIR